MEVNIKKVHPNAIIPEYKTSGAAGFDFHLVEDVDLQAYEIKMIPTGLVISVPDNHMLLVASRGSGPIKHGTTMANAVGIVDSDYCGPEDEIFLIARNLREEVISLKKGDRIAQGIILPVVQVTFHEVDNIIDRNRGGHGSTGK